MPSPRSLKSIVGGTTSLPEKATFGLNLPVDRRELPTTLEIRTTRNLNKPNYRLMILPKETTGTRFVT